MDDMAIDELLSFLSEENLGMFPTLEELTCVDREGRYARAEPQLALGYEATGVSMLPHRLDEAMRTPSPDENDENDNTHVILEGGSTSSFSPEMTSLVAKRKPKRRSCKDELMLLRDQVARLTTRLNALKTAAGIDVATPVARVPAAQAGALVTITASRDLGLWEKLAARQLARRQASEEENRELLEAVKQQNRRANRLRSMLRKRALNEQRRSLANVLHRPNAITPVSLRDDERVFQSLAETMDEAYAVIDSIFSAAKMHEVPCPGRHSSGRGLGPGQWSVDVRDVYVLPFDAKQTVHAAWAFLSKAAGNHVNEVRRSFRYLFQHPVGDITMQERLVARRYREQERTVVILRAMTHPVPGVSVRATRYVVIKNGPESISGPTAVIETYVSASGSATTEILASVDDKVRLHRQSNPQVEVDDFGLKQWEKSISRMHAEIEDALMEQTTRGEPIRSS